MSAKNLIIRGGADFSAVKKELDKTQKQLTMFQKGISKTMAGVGVLLGGLALGGLVKDIIQTSAKTETLNVAMAAVARSTGTSAEALKQNKKAVMELGIAEQEATQIMTRFMQSQLKIADAAKIARVAQDAGTIAGLNSSEAANQMVEAIAKLRPQLLSAFGFTRGLNDIYGDYAKTVGKTASKLGEAEKKQAMVNYILKEGEKIAGSYESAMGTFGKKLGSIDKLSLPKKLMQELKTSLGAPLILPGAGMMLDGIIEQLSAMKMWALDNEQTLRRWGQTIASAIKGVVGGFKALTKAIADNWAVLKFLLTTFITYVAVTKGAAIATKAFQIVQLTLKGELMTQIPLLTGVSRAIGNYRLQMALAPAVTGVFARSLMGLRVALYGVWTALGPIGWGILAISGIVSGGMALWSKYSNSLNAVATISDKQIKSGEESAGVLKDQAEAMKEAGKAAKGNLQGFDEIHQLQKEMAGGGSDMLDELGLGDMGGGGVPPLNLDDLLSGLDEIKPTLSGFWDWLKEGTASAFKAVVDGIKGYWQAVADATRFIWEPIIKYLNFIWDNLGKYAFKAFGLIGNYIVDSWKNIFRLNLEIWSAIIEGLITQWDLLKTAATNIFKNIADIITGKIDLRTGIKNIWGEIATYLKGTWENIKKTAEAIWGAISKYFDSQFNLTRDLAINIWNVIKTALETVWNGIKVVAEIIWDSIKANIETSWVSIKSKAEEVWTGIGTLLKETWETIKLKTVETWETIGMLLFVVWDAIKLKSEEVWSAIKNFLIDTIWIPIQVAATTVFTAIKQTITTIFDAAKSYISNVWDSIAAKLAGVWNGIKVVAKEVWNGIWDIIKGVINHMIEGINKFIDAWNNIEIKVPKIEIPFVGTVGGFSVSVPKIKNIPRLAKGGIIDSPTLALLGEAGKEAVVPLENTAFVDTLASAVGNAVLAAIQVSTPGNTSQNQDRSTVIQIDGKTLARILLPHLNDEEQRVGTSILQPL